MANPIVYLVAIVLSILVLFAAVSLYLIRMAGVSASCGDGMWNVALASLLLRLPMAFVRLRGAVHALTHSKRKLQGRDRA
jgi:hypothetical protein